MIKLTANDDWQHAEFYFWNIRDCNKFKYVFANHWCNVDWNKVEQIPDSELSNLSEFHRNSMDEDPEERGRKALDWGFNSYMKQHSERSVTPAQAEFVDKMVESIIAGG